MAREAVAPINRLIADLEKSGADPEELVRLRLRRAEIMTARSNDRARARTPLFADQVIDRLPDEQLEREERQRRERAAMLAGFLESARTYRASIATAVSPEALKALDEGWARFKGPHVPAYEADYWLQHYRATFGRNPMNVPYRPGKVWPPPIPCVKCGRNRETTEQARERFGIGLVCCMDGGTR